MRRFIAIVVCSLSIACQGAAQDSPSDSTNILFVGNSLIYVGNLPAVVDAVAKSNRHLAKSDMIASGGATLTDRVNDGSVAKALAAKKYAYVVLQERGGDFACGFGPEVCVNARTSLKTLADLARQHGATPLLLGTYQGSPEGSRRIVEAEGLAAMDVGVAYVSISNRLDELRLAYPDMSWFASDGMHPGPDLTLLDALLLFERLFMTKPLGADLQGLPAGMQYKSGEVAKLVETLW